LQQVRVTPAGLLKIGFALLGRQFQGSLKYCHFAFVRMDHRYMM
jgi:hypothetical protein